VAGESIAQAEFEFTFVVGKLRDFWRWRGDMFAENFANHPITAFDRTGAEGWSVLGGGNGHWEETAAGVASGVVVANPCVRADVEGGEAVMGGEQRIDKSVIGKDEIGDRLVILENVIEQADRLFEHRLAEIVIERFETAAINCVVFFEAA